jgi:hypothetical protein
MPRAGSPSWWATKIRQTRAFGRATVTAVERDGVARWLTPDQLRLFDSMHVADRRHGLDVVAWLRGHGEADDEVLLAGLLHDAGKGSTGFIPRVFHSLGQAYGGWIPRTASWLPGMRPRLDRLARHAETSARLAAEAGCSARTVELIRHQDDPSPADVAAQRLHLADEAS